MQNGHTFVNGQTFAKSILLFVHLFSIPYFELCITILRWHETACTQSSTNLHTGVYMRST